MNTPTKHFEAGPSKLDRIVVCPGSLKASRQFPDTGGEAAAKGSSLHSFLEICLKTRKVPADFPTDGEWAVYTDADREAVTEVVEYVRDMLGEFPGELFVETEVDLDRFYPGMMGTADVVIISGRTMIVIDAKFGRNPVPASTNQLKAYGVGLLENFSTLDFDDVIVTIAQPLIGHYDEVRYTPDELRQWAAEVMVPALDEAFGDAPRFNPDPVACKYCPARAVCAVRKAAHYDAVAAALADAPEVALLSNDELAQILNESEKFVAYVEDVRAHVVRELLAHRRVPGYKLVEGRSIRKWANPATTIDELAAALIRKRPEIAADEAVRLVTTTAPINITTAERLLGKSHPVFASLTVKPQGKATLALESDPHPAYIHRGDVSETLDAVEI